MASGRERAYFDIQVSGQHAGRIIFQLYSDIVPKTAQNFRALCTGQKEFGYKGTEFFRILPNFMAQGGQVISDSTGFKSIYGDKFQDENFEISHSRPFLLSMANEGKNTNTSQFFITFSPCEWLDGKHVAFGQVIQGKDICNLIESKGSYKTGKPTERILIKNCGQL